MSDDRRKSYATCEHCRRRIGSEPNEGWLHDNGANRHLMRCDPADTERPYGLIATPAPDPAAREQALADAVAAIEARANDPSPLCSGDHDIRFCGDCDSLDDGMFLAADVVRSLSQPGSSA